MKGTERVAALVLFLVSAAVLLARGITTLDGNTYRNVHVTRTDATGISIIHAAGACSLPFTELPDSIKQEFGYDPAKVAVMAAEKQRLAQERAVIKQQKQELARLKQLRAANSEADASSPALPSAPHKSYEAKSLAEKDYSRKTYDAKSYESRTYDKVGSSGAGGDFSGKYTATGKAIYVGPRGGRFHYSANGKKVYERKR